MANDLQGEAQKPPQPTSICPHCGRKLLSTRSILCNWCGQRIDDPAYLERAAQERAAEDAKMRDEVQRENIETARRGILGRLKDKRKAGEIGKDNILLPPTDPT